MSASDPVPADATEPLALALAVAEQPANAAAGPWWWAATCAIGCAAGPRRISISRCSACRKRIWRRCSARSAGWNRGTRLSGLQAWSASTWPCPAASRRRARPHRLHGRGRSGHGLRRRRPPPRFHDERHRLGPAHRRIPRPVRRPRRPRRAPAARGRPAHLRRRQPAGAARPAVRRALRAARSTTRHGAICRAIPLDDLPAERLWGEFEKLLLVAERPSLGFALARDLGVVEQVLPEMVPLYDCPQDPEWHPEGDVWTHTLMVIDEARQRNADLDRAPADRGDARRGVPRPRASRSPRR